MFNIKLTTKNGNNPGDKQAFTTFFKLKFKKNSLTKKLQVRYTYRILYGKNQIFDNRSVLEFKDETLSIEDAILKVVLNAASIITKICNREKINPDFIIFISPDLNFRMGNKDRNLSYMFLKGVFSREYKTEGYKGDLNQEVSAKIDLLNTFVELNPNTSFRSFDPNYNPNKYAKSIEICKELDKRFYTDEEVKKVKEKQLSLDENK